MNKRETYQIEVFLHAETPSAVLVADHNLRRRDDGKVWFPKSQVTWSTIRRGEVELILLSAPGWLIEDRGLDHLC